jgi:hypothetical protein
MGQAVSRRPLTAEARVRALVSPCGVCGGKSDTGTGFSLSSWAFPCQCHSTVALHTHISSGGWTIGPFETAVQRHSLTPLTWTWKIPWVIESSVTERWSWTLCWLFQHTSQSRRRHLVHLNLLSWNFPGCTEENHEKSVGITGIRDESEPGSSWIRRGNTNN